MISIRREIGRSIARIIYKEIGRPVIIETKLRIAVINANELKDRLDN